MDYLLIDPLTGRRLGLDVTMRRVVHAMSGAEAEWCLIGAMALAARGLPRMTRDIDILVLAGDAENAIRALPKARLRRVSGDGDPVTFLDEAKGIKVDLHRAFDELEVSACVEAPTANMFERGVPAVTLEHLLLLYFHSHHAKHVADFATIVRSGKANLALAERLLARMFPKMLAEWKRRVEAATVPVLVTPKIRRPLRSQNPR